MKVIVHTWVKDEVSTSQAMCRTEGDNGENEMTIMKSGSESDSKE